MRLCECLLRTHQCLQLTAGGPGLPSGQSCSLCNLKHRVKFGFAVGLASSAAGSLHGLWQITSWVSWQFCSRVGEEFKPLFVLKSNLQHILPFATSHAMDIQSTGWKCCQVQTGQELWEVTFPCILGMEQGPNHSSYPRGFWLCPSWSNHLKNPSSLVIELVSWSKPQQNKLFLRQGDHVVKSSLLIHKVEIFRYTVKS